jgi:DNA-directed RNA polymerase specialized sigma24 family protein
MQAPDRLPPELRNRLREITTEAGLMGDALTGSPEALRRLMLRYQNAMRSLLGHLLHDEVAVDTVADRLLDRLPELYQRWNPQRGSRFRDYLLGVVRNAAIDHLRSPRHRERTVAPLDLAEQAAVPDPLEERAREEMRKKILEGAWQRLQQHEHASRGNLAFTVLRLRASLEEREGSPSTEGMVRALAEMKHPLSPEAVRQQLKRGRDLLAGLLWDETRQTLVEPTFDEVVSELCDLGLWELVRDHLQE